MDNKYDYEAKFKALYYTLYTNSSSSRAENINYDLTKILLYKLISESKNIAIPENVTGDNILKVLSSLLPNGTKIENFILSDQNIQYVISELKDVKLSNAPSHIIGDAFQSIISPRIRGDKGQFFTPEELVNCMVKIIGLPSAGVIADPACGTGGFLIQSYSELKHNTDISNDLTLVGIDKDPDMYNLALATTSIITDGHSKIYNTNSLEIPSKKNALHHLLGKVDVILTNPPFGAKIGVSDENILANYELGHNWTYSKKDNKWYMLDSLMKTQAPQILFLELSIKLLKKSGKLGIVLPEGIFGNKSLGYIWQFLRKNGCVTALIDCPRNTFQPSTDTKTNVLFFTKGIPFNDNIDVAIAKQCGHDKRGRKFTSEKKPWPNDYLIISNDFYANHKKYWKSVQLTGDYFVPRYLVGKAKYNRNADHITIGQLIKKGYLKIKSGKEIGSEAYGTGDVPFIRTSDINNYEISSDPTNSVSEDIYLQYADQQNLKVGDILFIADGRYRIGKTAIITPYNIKCLIQSHIDILSLNDDAPFTPFELLYTLNEDDVQDQIRSMVFIQSTLGTIGNRINEIALPLPPRTEEWKIKISSFKNNIETRAKCLNSLKDTEHSYCL